jgi:hypothetical protein
MITLVLMGARRAASKAGIRQRAAAVAAVFAQTTADRLARLAM